MQISTQSRKRLLFAALFLAILVPLFFTLEIRARSCRFSGSRAARP